MNREIKFRVRNKETGEIIGYERISAGGHWEQQRVNRQEWLLGVITDGQIALELIREQYTGLKDKNGKEIYEGDIMKSDDGAVVQLYWDLCGFSSKVIKKSESINTNYFANLWQSRDFEVIGNIYQNPELLK